MISYDDYKKKQQQNSDIMKIYLIPETEITRLHLAHGVMEGDDSIDFDNAQSIFDGVIQANGGSFDDEEDTGIPSSHTSLWED